MILLTYQKREYVRVSVTVDMPGQSGAIEYATRAERRQLVNLVLSTLLSEAGSWTALIEQAFLNHKTPKRRRPYDHRPAGTQRLINGVWFNLTVSMALRATVRNDVVDEILQKILKANMPAENDFPSWSLSDTDTATKLREDADEGNYERGSGLENEYL